MHFRPQNAPEVLQLSINNDLGSVLYKLYYTYINDILVYESILSETFDRAREVIAFF